MYTNPYSSRHDCPVRLIEKGYGWGRLDVLCYVAVITPRAGSISGSVESRSYSRNGISSGIWLFIHSIPHLKPIRASGLEGFNASLILFPRMDTG